MAQLKSHEITDLLVAWSKGSAEALEKLTPMVYQELHRLARSHRRKEKAGHALQASSLVNKAFLRLILQTPKCENRSHFFGIAAQLMRQVLVDEARKRDSAKRGGQLEQVSLGAAADLSTSRSMGVLALDDALKTLAAFDKRSARIVEMHFFGGLTEKEIAEVMNVSARTVRRDWNAAKAYLYGLLNPEEPSQKQNVKSGKEENGDES